MEKNACFECMFQTSPYMLLLATAALKNALDESYRIICSYFALASSGIAQAQPNRITSASDGQFSREEMLFLLLSLLHCQSLCYQA